MRDSCSVTDVWGGGVSYAPNGFYWVLLGFTEIIWFLFWFDLGLPSFTGINLVLSGFTGFYEVVLSFTKLHWVLLSFY